VHDAFTAAISYVTTYGLSVLGGFIILVVGWTVAGWASKAVDAALGRFQRFDLTLRRFIASVVRYVILTFTCLAVLSQFGVQTTSVIAVFGAAGLAIGLALQGTLANLAAGVMILLFRPFKIGDDVDAGGSRGRVESIDLFTTELRTADNVQLLVPNGKIWGTPVINYSFHQTRRLDLKLVIDGAFDIDRAIRTVRDTLAKDSRTLQSPPPAVTVAEIGESTTTLTAQAWCKGADHDDLETTLMKSVKDALQAALKTVAR
jgi:small conductance mechanosensitive channel